MSNLCGSFPIPSSVARICEAEVYRSRVTAAKEWRLIHGIDRCSRRGHADSDETNHVFGKRRT